MNSRKQSLSNKHQNNHGQKHLFVEPPDFPAEKKCKPQKETCDNEEYLFCIKEKRSEIHIYFILYNL